MSDDTLATNENNYSFLIVGKSDTGKTTSYRNLRDPDGVLVINCESGKKLPFKAKMREAKLSNPLKIYSLIAKANASDKIHTIVIDSLTFLMDMVESQIVLKSEDTRGAWQDYQQFFKKLMQEYVAVSTKNIIFTAHTAEVYNEKELATYTCVKVKGALMNNGIEAWFNNVLACKVMSTDSLEGYENNLLDITEDDKLDGIKYVYQTRKTRDTLNERIRGPLGMWERNETFIDNDLQKVIDRLHEYYGEE